MSVEVIIAAAAGAALYLWAWRPARYVVRNVQRKRRSDAFERALRAAREDVAGGCPYRLAGEGDRELLDLLRVAEGLVAELAACDFRELCDLVVQAPGKEAASAARALVDAAGTSCALVLVTRKTQMVVLRLMSWAGDRAFVTARKPDASLALPPSVQRTVVDAKLPCAELVGGHRALAGDASLRAVATGEELLAALTAHYEAIVRWRAAQPPDELLDADLQCVLGKAYATSGKAWARRLRGKLPEATLRRA